MQLCGTLFVTFCVAQNMKSIVNTAVSLTSKFFGFRTLMQLIFATITIIAVASGQVYTEYTIPTSVSGPRSICLGSDNALWWRISRAWRLCFICLFAGSQNTAAVKLDVLRPAAFSLSTLFLLPAPRRRASAPGQMERSGKLCVSGVLNDGLNRFTEYGAQRIGRLTVGGSFTGVCLDSLVLISCVCRIRVLLWRISRT